MDYVVPYDQLGVSTPGPWTNASPQAGVQGSIVNANVFPAIQNEILNVQDEALLTRDSTNNAQLLQAIRSGKLTFFADTGTADALIITPRTSLPNFAAGLELAILKNPQVGANATATPRLTAGSLSMTFVKEDGSALAAGDLPAGSLFTARSDGTSLRVQGLRKSDASAAPPGGTEGVKLASGSYSLDFPDLTEEDTLSAADLVAFYASEAEGGQASGHHYKTGFGNFSKAVLALIPTVLPSVSPARNLTSYTTAGTYTFTVPTGVTWIFGRVVGAGGGGGGGGNGSSTPWAGAGGGSGGYAEGWVAVTPGQVITVVVGAGGAGGTPTNGTYGTTGGTSSLGASMSATGGVGGCAGSPGNGGFGGVGSGGQDAFAGAPGNDGNSTSFNYPGGVGGSSAFGGGGRTATLGPSSATGGGPSTAPNGKSPGSGGGGIYGSGGGASVGGSGADGGVFIEY